MEELPEQERLVNILKWSLLPNHYHLLIQEVVDGGIVEFTKRIGNSYTKYFNTKYKTSGYLFQNSARIVPLENDGHYMHVPLYVELNPAWLAPRTAKSQTIDTRAHQMLDFMEQYVWSSYRDYVGKKTFPQVINANAFFEFFENEQEPKEYREYAKEWLTSKIEADGEVGE